MPQICRPSFERGETPQARPMPCPQCESTKGYSRVGRFRVQCLNCNSLLANEEVDMQIPTEENE